LRGKNQGMYRVNLVLYKLLLIEFPTVPTWPIFEKNSHLRKKGGVLMLLKTTHHLGAKAQYTHHTTHDKTWQTALRHGVSNIWG
jgi:hypothetical protein